MTSPERPPFTVRVANRDDADRLIGLFNRAFNKEKDARTSRWKYFDNPHGASRTYLAEDGGVSGGAYSYVFRRMTFRGVPFLGTQASDAMVDVAFRKRGIFTTLDNEAARDCGEGGSPVCFATAGRQSMHGFLKNGWREIGTYVTHVALLDLPGLLRGKLPSPLATLAGGMAKVPLGLMGKLPRVDLPPGHEVIEIDRFDGRFDQLWERSKNALPMAGVRDSAYLNWRFVDTPTGKHQRLGIVRDGDLVGYAVYESGIDRRGYVVDLLGLDVDAEDAALRGALAAIRRAGIPMAFFSSLPCERISALLKRNHLFPHPRQKPFRTATPFIVRVLRDDLDPPPKTLTDPNQWYVLDGDRDVEHMSPA